MTTNQTANKSGIRPSGHRLVLRPEELQKVSKGGIILYTEQQADREELAQIYGRVVEVGPGCWKDSFWDYIAVALRLKKPWAKAGDRVIFGKYSGLVFPGQDGGTYRVINDRDVVAVVDEIVPEYRTQEELEQSLRREVA